MFYRGLFLLWSQVGLVWMAQLSLGSILTTLGVGLAWRFKGRLHLSVRTLVPIAIAWGAVCLLLSRALPVSGLLLGPGAHYAAVLSSGLAGLATAVKLTEERRFAAVFFVACTLVFSGMSVHTQEVAILSTVGLLLLLGALREESGLAWSWSRRLWKLPMLGVATGLTLAAVWSETRLGLLLGLFAFVPIPGVQFPPVSTLTSLQKWESSDVVALRVYGEAPPLYLVGRTFYRFDSNHSWRWTETQKLLESTESIRVPSIDTPIYLYPSPQAMESADRARPLRVEYPGDGSGFTLYAPRNYAELGCELPALHRYSDETLQARTLDHFSGIYLLFPPSQGWHSPIQSRRLDPQTSEAALELPEGLTPLVSHQAERLVGHLDSPREKAEELVRYFQTEFQYGYGHRFSSPQHALHEFLEKRPPAHCEFFATSAALMLRSQGVPTRYLNGFVIQERSFDGTYYIVRLKHAHAWIEAFLPDEGWTSFDPTPPEALDDPSQPPRLWLSLMERTSELWRRLLRTFSGSPVELLRKGLYIVKDMASDPRTGLGLVLVLTALGARSIWRRRKLLIAEDTSTRFRLDHPDWTPFLVELQDRLEPRLHRASPQETLRQWYTRLSEELPDSDKVIDFLKMYESLRYRCSPPSQDLAEHRGQLRTALEKIFETPSSLP